MNLDYLSKHIYIIYSLDETLIKLYNYPKKKKTINKLIIILLAYQNYLQTGVNKSIEDFFLVAQVTIE